MMGAVPEQSKHENLANRPWLERIAEVITRDAERTFSMIARTRSGQGRNRPVDRNLRAEHDRATSTPNR